MFVRTVWIGIAANCELVLSRLKRLTSETVETEAEANQQGKRKRFWSFSKSDARRLVFCYAFSFLMCRLDIDRHHAFRHPMPSIKAAWVAIPLALATAVLVKIKDRD